ncbi:MAG: GNAT family N-acetyltransferase [Ignavibacteria bacterium]|nr:GNAT family N-acetyltransferase [Ignavibacteria bacterium]
MNLDFTVYKSEDADKLAQWISSDKWPYHGNPEPTMEKVKKWISEGTFEGEDNRAFWIYAEGNIYPAGLITLHEFTDDTPIFDLRIKSEFRGKGIGKLAVQWLVEYLFTKTDKERLEGHTRADNAVMRKVFRDCGWVKEAHHRRCWPDNEGNKFDSITYAVLKEDYLKGEKTPVNWNDE